MKEFTNKLLWKHKKGITNFIFPLKGVEEGLVKPLQVQKIKLN